jgi:hypothetical protein
VYYPDPEPATKLNSMTFDLKKADSISYEEFNEKYFDEFQRIFHAINLGTVLNQEN